MAISTMLKATNSSGRQNLEFSLNDEKDLLDICLFGNLGDKHLQVNFDALCKEEVQEIIDVLKLNLIKMYKQQRAR